MRALWSRISLYENAPPEPRLYFGSTTEGFLATGGGDLKRAVPTAASAMD